MQLFRLLATTFLIGAAGLSAHVINNDISLIGGYQQGKFEQGMFQKFPEGRTSPFFGELPPGYKQGQEVSANLDLGVLGLEGRYFFPQLNCSCDVSALNNVYLTGHAIWGWGNKNHFKDVYRTYLPSGLEIPEFALASDYIGKGKLKKSRSYDYNIGVGYLFDLNCLDFCDLTAWSLGLEGGYSYRKITLTTKNGDDGEYSCQFADESNYFFPDDPAYKGTKFSNQWQGGWIGAQLFYTACDWDLSVGYAYHISNYKGKYETTPIGLETDFNTTKAKANSAYGNVWTVQADYDLYCNWTIGFLFNHEYWNARKGSNTVIAPQNGNAEAYDAPLTKTHNRSSWDAYTISANLGYEF